MANGIYPRDRQCTWERDGERCITILHTSNPGPLCECHEEISKWERMRRRRQRDLERRIESVKPAEFAPPLSRAA